MHLRIFLTLLLLCFAYPLAQAENRATETVEKAESEIEYIWNSGKTELYLPLYTYHMPFAYSSEKRAKFTSYPMGLGIGKGLINANGNWEGIYVMSFQDSHGLYQYMAGYGWVPLWNMTDSEFKYGLGVTAFVMSREDIDHYIPFPGILPIASIRYKDLSLETTYIPGGKNVGNVIFTWGKFSF